MIKKEYIKPATQIIEAEMEQEILVGSGGIRSTNDSTDEDNPNYDDTGFGDLWDAN